MSNWKHPFEYQSPNKAMVEDITRVREACKGLYNLLTEIGNKNYILGQSLGTYSSQANTYFIEAVTRLEEVSMFANKAIAFSGGYQQEDTSLGA